MNRVRLRLTVFYAALLAAASGLLLGASYLLVRDRLFSTLDEPAAGQAVGALGSQYALALVAVIVLAAGAGWMVSGELLRPLELAVERQRAFVANASHELRTPMTAIRAAAEVALDEPRATTAELRSALREIVASSGETERMMTALLGLADATHGARSDEQLELDRVVDAALPDDPRIRTDLQPAVVRGDQVLLARATVNLAENALRHGKPGGPVYVRVRDAEVTVANGGAPIAASELRRLTEPFERLGRTAAGPGSGLGLSIVKAIAEAHGGRLELAAPPAGGLVARVILARSH